MSTEIRSFDSVGGLKFGQKRNVVRAQLGPNFDTFVKDVGENETDAYDDLGFHLYYDKDDRLEAVEAFAPADLSLSGVRLLGRPVSDVLIDLGLIGRAGRPIDVGYQYDDCGITLIVDPLNVVEGVTIFRKGYYDN